MATHVSQELRRTFGALRYEPVSRRVRCHLGEVLIFDTTDAMLVWQPRQVVPNYAIPEQDFQVPLTVYDAGPPEDRPLPPVISPDEFSMHSTPGQRLSLVVAGQELTDVAFRPDDPDIGGRVTVQWIGAAFDWMEEEEPVVGHPHDPFSRIDILRSSRHVVVSLDGVMLADSERPAVLYETGLPPRWYLPREDIRMDLLEATDSRSVCAYKGYASYFSVIDAGDDGRDVAWTYLDPRHDAARVRGMVCFYSELTDYEIDGEPQKRPRTYWSR